MTSKTAVLIPVENASEERKLKDISRCEFASFDNTNTFFFCESRRNRPEFTLPFGWRDTPADVVNVVRVDGAWYWLTIVGEE